MARTVLEVELPPTLGSMPMNKNNIDMALMMYAAEGGVSMKKMEARAATNSRVAMASS